MTFNDYLSTVESRFAEKNEVSIGRFKAMQFYDEVFKVKWVATKLKIFSFVAFQSELRKQDMIDYTNLCLEKALNEYKGLPRGMQNGVASFSVMAAENIDAETIAFAMSRPKKHFAAFEMPVIFDLTANKLFYYEKTPIWGSIYYKHFREHIEKCFNSNMLSH